MGDKINWIKNTKFQWEIKAWLTCNANKNMKGWALRMVLSLKGGECNNPKTTRSARNC